MQIPAPEVPTTGTQSREGARRTLSEYRAERSTRRPPYSEVKEEEDWQLTHIPLPPSPMQLLLMEAQTHKGLQNSPRRSARDCAGPQGMAGVTLKSEEGCTPGSLMHTEVTVLRARTVPAQVHCVPVAQSSGLSLLGLQQAATTHISSLGKDTQLDSWNCSIDANATG